MLRLWVRIPPGAWIFFCCECCALSSRGLRDGLISRLEESYWLWCVVVCDLETSWMRRPWPTWGGGSCVKNKQTNGHSINLTSSGINSHWPRHLDTHWIIIFVIRLVMVIDPFFIIGIFHYRLWYMDAAHTQTHTCEISVFDSRFLRIRLWNIKLCWWVFGFWCTEKNIKGAEFGGEIRDSQAQRHGLMFQTNWILHHKTTEYNHHLIPLRTKSTLSIAEVEPGTIGTITHSNWGMT